MGRHQQKTVRVGSGGRSLAPLRILALAAVGVCGVAACSADGRRSDTAVESGAAQSPRGKDVRTPGPLRTPNADPNSARNLPDWEARAQALRARVAPELTVTDDAPLGPLCDQMMRDAETFYVALGGDDVDEKAKPSEQAEQAEQASVGRSKVQASPAAQFRQTRAADRAACERELSPRAAQCVSLQLARRTAEFPWWVDQCARAFPRAGDRP